MCPLTWENRPCRARGTVLAPPQVRVSARWISRSRAASIEMQVTGVALLLASARWLGPLAWLGMLPLAGSALIFWAACRLQTRVQS
jgi:hypothetical protein